MTASPPPDPPPFAPVSASVRQRGDRARHSEPWSTRDLSWLAGAALLGVVLRLWHLEQWSLSAAEAATWQGATEPLRTEHGFLASDRSYHPLAFLSLRGLFAAGLLPFHGEGWLRLPFAFVGMLTVPLLALVGDLLVGRTAALLAAGLLAVHPWHVAGSQTASGEVLAVFCGLSAVGAGVVAHRLAHRVGAALALALGLAAAGCHPSGWVVVAGLAAGALAVAGSPGRQRFFAAAGAALVLGPAAAAIAIAGGPAAVPPVGDLAAAARPSLWILAAFGAVSAGHVGVAADERRWLAIAVGAPLLAALALPTFGVPGGVGIALPALPALLLLGSIGARRCFELVVGALSSAPRPLALVPAALVPAVFGLDLAVETFLYGSVHQGNRTDWRAAADTVLDSATRGRPIVVLAGAGSPSLTYYLRPNQWREPDADPNPGVMVRNVAAAELAELADWLAAARKDRDVFLVLDRAELARAQQHAPSARLLAEVFSTRAVVPQPSNAAEGTVYVHRAAPVQSR